MGWQEELRLLDAKLADGSLTPSQHRKMRDELLAAASGGGSPSPRTSPTQTSPTQTSPTRPNQPETVRLPRPEPQRAPVAGQPMPAGQVKPEPRLIDERPVPKKVDNRPTLPLSHPAPPVAETYNAATQPHQQPHQQPQAPQPQPQAQPPKPSAASLLAGDRPTTAPSPADYRATEALPSPPRNPLRGRGVVPSVSAHQSTRPYSPQAAQWSTPQPILEPDLERNDRPRNTKAIAFLAAGVLLAGGLLAGGWLWLSGDDEPKTPAAQAPPPTQPLETLPTTPRPVTLEDRLPQLPGLQNKNNSTMPVDKGLELKLYAPDTAELFRVNGATEVVYRSSAEASDGYLIMVVPASSPEGAKRVADGLRAAAVTTGFNQVQVGNGPARNALAGANTAGRMNATWYTSGNLAIAVWVSQGLDQPESLLGQHLTETMQKVEAALPPD